MLQMQLTNQITMKRPFILLLLLSALLTSWGQPSSTKDQVAVRYASLITEEGLRDKLSILASDALEGRMTGTRGQKMAAAFIRHHFESLGLKGPVNGSFYQSVPLVEQKPGENSLVIGGQTISNYTDQFFFGMDNTNGIKKATTLLLGNVTIDELSKIEVKGKAVILYSPELGNASFQEIFEKSNQLHEAGAAAVIVSPDMDDNKFDDMKNQFKGWQGEGSLSLASDVSRGLNVFFLRRSMVGKIYGTTTDNISARLAKNRKPKETEIGWINESITKSIESENVLGFLEGTDKKNEVVVITAHMDHVGNNGSGEDKIFNGADDDGSGTSAVMQLAEAFATAAREGIKPRRSMLFMTVTGEEEGLFGSEHYVNNPVFPLANTVVDLNIDMIGRTDPQHASDHKYVYAIGSDKLSTELHQLHESVNSTYSGLAIDYTYNDENHPERLYYRSDHWNFAKNNVPIIFYFDGIHEDYHKTSDEVSKIEFDMLAARSKLVFHTAWELANRPGRIQVDKK